MSSDNVDGPSMASIEFSSEVNDLDEIQDIIDISADRLEGLRTQCATSATLTQQEIRTLESKLIRMFSDLLLKKARLNERVPSNGLPHTNTTELKQWLRVVGLSQDSVNVCLTRVSTLEELLEQNDEELKQIISHNPNFREEEVRRLTKAMHNLKKYMDFLSNGIGNGSTDGVGGLGNITSSSAGTEDKDSPAENEEILTEQLFWDSWDRHHMHRGSVGNIGGITSSPRPHRMNNKQGKSSHYSGSSSRQSPAHDLSSKSSISAMNTPDDLSSMKGSNLTLTLTPSPPNSPFSPPSAITFHTACSGSIGGSLNGTPQRGKFAGTPPPLKKHQTLLNSGQSMTPTHLPSMMSHSLLENSSYTKEKYNESSHYHQENILASPPNHLTGGNSSKNLINKINAINTADPSPDSYSSASSELYIENNNNANNSLHVPRSPGTPVVKVGMTHNVKHRFIKVIKIRASCDLCQKPMYFGLKCKECKYRSHKECEANVPPSCGLPPEYVDTFKILTQPNLHEHISFQTIGSGGVGHHQIQPSSVSNISNTSPSLGHKGHHSFPKHSKPDSSSPGSSCNSSSPSSPALLNLQHHGSQQSGSSAYGGSSYMTSGNVMSSSGGASSSNSSNHLSTPSSHKQTNQFHFPDVTLTSNTGGNVVGTQTLYTSQISGNNDCLDLQESNYHDGTSLSSVKSIISTTSGTTQSLVSSFTVSSSNGSNVTLTSSLGGFTNEVVRSIGAGSNSISSSLINSSSNTTFYQRKLSSAGVDKRPAFNSDLSDTHKSNDSDKTVSLSGSTSASTDSDRTPIRLDSTEDGDSGNWPRQNSLSLKEWDIPYSDLSIKEKIGKGRFGTVHRALWHGDVAVKLLKKDYLADEQMLEAFKSEVANFKKTRHENLVLFMGACMNPPHLAIVTSLCKGNTLYTYIHQRHEKFTINKTTLVAQQISQGMGYLHARGIYHKDLRTKNIFLENGKVIITDFGLFSSTKLLYCDIGLGVPNGWLCYLAPELMRALTPVKPKEEILPFSQASDVYSFGTVWYELLCGEFPFRKQPHESIIWQVGRGMKQSLANLQTSRDVKDILMLCWKYTKTDRPDFPTLLILLERLPKKRLARSPSHPVQLSRSAESVF